MEEFNIYKYIEEIELDKDNFLEFVTTLCNYFSKRFGVRPCALINVIEINGTSLVKTYVPPARFSWRCTTHKDEKTGKVWFEVEKESIDFSTALLDDVNKARIVKLAAHEWMHFYDYLFRIEDADITKIDINYKDLILRAHKERDSREQAKEKYKDDEIFSSIYKLSAEEMVADKHAQKFLKELYENVSYDVLKFQINQQIIWHEQQINNCKLCLEKNNIEEECVEK